MCRWSSPWRHEGGVRPSTRNYVQKWKFEEHHFQEMETNENVHIKIMKPKSPGKWVWTNFANISSSVHVLFCQFIG